MSLADARVIDIHAHAVIEKTFGTAGEFGPELYDDGDTPVFRIGDYKLRGVKYRGSAFMDPNVRIAAMDRAGIDVLFVTDIDLELVATGTVVEVLDREAVQGCQVGILSQHFTLLAVHSIGCVATDFQDILADANSGPIDQN